MDLEKFEKVTSEKYEYIFRSSDSGSWYSDVKFVVNNAAPSPEGGLSEFYVDFSADCQKSSDGDAYAVGHLLKQITEEIYDFLGSYVVNPKTLKFDKSFEKLTIAEPVVLSFDYKIDERHFVELSYHIYYDD